MFGIGFQEALVVIILFLILVDPKKAPDMAKVIGNTIAKFQRSLNGVKKDLKDLKEDVMNNDFIEIDKDSESKNIKENTKDV